MHTATNVKKGIGLDKGQGYIELDGNLLNAISKDAMTDLSVSNDRVNAIYGSVGSKGMHHHGKKSGILPQRKRMRNLRKKRYYLAFTGVHQAENPIFSASFRAGEFKYSFHYRAVFCFGEREKTRVFWRSPFG